MKMTLKELIEDRKCRKGQPYGTTTSGAFWLVCDEIKIRRFGGDGIGQSDAERTNFLQLRHYRDGTVKALARYNVWHQNWGDGDSFYTVPILDCETIEEVISVLKGTDEDECQAFGDNHKEALTNALKALGMEEAAPAPDEEQEMQVQ